MRTALLIVLASVTVVGTGCSSSSSSTPKAAPAASNAPAATTATTAARVDYAAQYRAIADPENAAAKQFDTAKAALPDTATAADLQKIATPLADALDRADQQLLRASWPSNAVPDVKALTAAGGAVVVDLRNAGRQDASTMNQWASTFTQDLGKMKGQIDIVRADLGLPPRSN